MEKMRPVTSSGPLFITKKLNMRRKQVEYSLVSIYFNSPQGLVSPLHFVYDFSRKKMFLMLHSID